MAGPETTALAHVRMDELIARLGEIRESPQEEGTVELIVRRPAVDEREVLDEAELDEREGLVGDSWRARGSRHAADGAALRALQLTLMNARSIGAIARARERWPLAGDQLFVDFDLSLRHLPPGTRLAVGTAVVEVSDVPHTGCAKFSRRFGSDALRFVNSPPGRALRLRGMNARIVASGRVRPGDVIRRL